MSASATSSESASAASEQRTIEAPDTIATVPVLIVSASAIVASEAASTTIPAVASTAAAPLVAAAPAASDYRSIVTFIETVITASLITDHH